MNYFRKLYRKWKNIDRLHVPPKVKTGYLGWPVDQNLGPEEDAEMSKLISELFPTDSDGRVKNKPLP